jgi:hypothetical protein
VGNDKDRAAGGEQKRVGQVREECSDRAWSATHWNGNELRTLPVSEFENAADGIITNLNLVDHELIDLVGERRPAGANNDLARGTKGNVRRTALTRKRQAQPASWGHAARGGAERWRVHLAVRENDNTNQRMLAPRRDGVERRIEIACGDHGRADVVRMVLGNRRTDAEHHEVRCHFLCRPYDDVEWIADVEPKRPITTAKPPAPLLADGAKEGCRFNPIRGLALLEALSTRARWQRNARCVDRNHLDRRARSIGKRCRRENRDVRFG